MPSGFVIRCEDAPAFRKKLLNRWNPRFLVSCRAPGAPADRNENFSAPVEMHKMLAVSKCNPAGLERKRNLLTSVFIYAEDIFTRIFHPSYSEREAIVFDVFGEFFKFILTSLYKVYNSYVFRRTQRATILISEVKSRNTLRISSGIFASSP